MKFALLIGKAISCNNNKNYVKVLKSFTLLVLLCVLFFSWMGCLELHWRFLSELFLQVQLASTVQRNI